MEQLKTHEAYLKKAIEVSRAARAHGNAPFGAILVDAEGSVLMEQENTVLTGKNCTHHAETALAARASGLFSREILKGCTLYSSAEPCAMCAGAIYWCGLGRVVYGLSEARLLSLTGSHPENPTLSLPCRRVFEAGQRPIEVLGPFLEDEAAEVHLGFWQA